MTAYSDPATYTKSLTPSDTESTDGVRALRVGLAAGHIAVEYRDGSTDTILNVQVGESLPMRPVKVLDTGTTATGITGFF